MRSPRSAIKVTIIGQGHGATRIRGNVTITGNNADLRGARIQGRVRSSGNNNRW
ncbi:MAG: hypothetical protein JW820_10660 [Spirochaetales bacterium]|nr:hypothetical protein [Spirochaetales bacterium]